MVNSIENALIEYNGFTVYQMDIDGAIEEYKQSLPDESMIYKTACFSGMLNRIYRDILKPIISSGKPNRNDYELLDGIFNNIYIPLCSVYGICPTVYQFAMFVNIDSGNLTDLNSGVYRRDGDKVNINKQRIVKKWFDVCKSFTVGKALNENSIGAIFVSKAVYGMTEQQTVVITSQLESNQDPAAIAEKYKSVAIPEKPEI